jgi:small subunit ribosomal protein S20
MPLIKSAIKKLRKDRARTIKNKNKKEHLKDLVKDARSDHSVKNLSAAFSALDKAAKTNLIHKNKANRLKSRLAKSNSIAPTVKKAAPKKKVAKKAKK